MASRHANPRKIADQARQASAKTYRPLTSLSAYRRGTDMISQDAVVDLPGVEALVSTSDEGASPSSREGAHEKLDRRNKHVGVRGFILLGSPYYISVGQESVSAWPTVSPSCDRLAHLHDHGRSISQSRLRRCGMRDLRKPPWRYRGRDSAFRRSAVHRATAVTLSALGARRYCTDAFSLHGPVNGPATGSYWSNPCRISTEREISR
jgi:hypothetical protein